MTDEKDEKAVEPIDDQTRQHRGCGCCRRRARSC